MPIKSIQDIIDILSVGDASLIYKGEAIFIDPTTIGGIDSYYLGYKDFDGDFDSQEELFAAKVIDGYSINDIYKELVAE